ncbi:MAG: F0F1 ATP synthase subunit A [Thermomicrobiales bacterium]
MEIHVSVKPETLFSVGPLNVTNSSLTMVIVMAVLVIVGAIIARRASVDNPGKLQSAFEIIVEFLQNLVYGTAGRRAGRRIFPLVAALFFFIIFSNYAGLLPGVGTIGKWEEHAEETTEEARVAVTSQGNDALVVQAQEEEAEHSEKVLVPFFRSPSADLNMTLAMALITFTIVQFAGISAHGVVGRIKHMADPWWIFPIELVSELARIISLSFRLFGNIFAGEVLVAVMVAMSRAMLLKFYIFPLLALPTVFLFLEVLFGFIQALVFALLTLIYISLAAAGHDDHDEAHAHAADRHPAPAAGSAGD